MAPMLFLLGFTAVTAVYEVAKSGKTTTSKRLERDVHKYGK